MDERAAPRVVCLHSASGVCELLRYFLLLFFVGGVCFLTSYGTLTGTTAMFVRYGKDLTDPGDHEELLQHLPLEENG